MPYDISQLNDMLIPELLDLAQNLKISNTSSSDKQILIAQIMDNQNKQPEEISVEPLSGDKKKRARKPKADKEVATEPAITEVGTLPEAPAPLPQQQEENQQSQHAKRARK